MAITIDWEKEKEERKEKEYKEKQMRLLTEEKEHKWNCCEITDK